MTFPFPKAPLLAGTACLALAACQQPLDYDLRGAFGNAHSTAEAAQTATTTRPQPDSRGIISYPGYQVAVARRGDTLASLAARIGADVQSLAQYNGMQTGDPLRKGEVIALPSRVAEPAGGPIQPPGEVDITTLAGDAINSAPDTATTVQSRTLPPSQTGVEPVRHKVERGETAYTIARLYNVSVRSLAEWNGLGADFAVREGQFLLIPVAQADSDTAQQTATTAVTAPGAGSPTPEPPSASTPLPEKDTTPAAKPVQTTSAPDLGATQTQTNSGARMAFPVRGDIIRDYAKGRNDGIDISAAAGTPVGAAADGVVAAITEDTNGIPIIVLKHPDNLLTVYSNIANVTVKKGDSVRRGGKLAEIRRDGAAALHFEVRDGFDSVDPNNYLN
ncbi:Murein DD-endopeptidase MepM and murein hydrolase activator NlpD, contain LysM domain [Roseovarius pacificus]|uniref:Murein DD-endopeptidase MepM and murein hydrolase activator NlpD, contain LysM domain n=1 Tax=Roseovarius pacificus TaxID=337701 RepID=A0A1M6XET1_9RHOB|nr:peptidoglycan DD-metalloendopeptidase family protein [Roseovarius pacificus]GGO52226.1 peptidase M23 [Roseovarius pacificus]SHL04428.1 Murein DD-endopeptidase MepM and murein hydrolase activator NlpD, contain LysM domain [Roseovarius pacificus]